MIKTMQARYAGRDAITGARIRPGDEIQYCTDTRRAWLAEPGDIVDHPSRYNPAWVSHVWTSASGREYYRNKAGRCEDAPCCGCCTA